MGTIRSTLSFYDFNGLSIGNALEDSSTLLETYSGILAPGTYYAQIASFVGHAQISPTFNDASYFDMGAYFLTGSGFVSVPEPGTAFRFADTARASRCFVSVPEPGTAFLLVIGLIGLAACRQRPVSPRA